jgi:hypothetical protein
MHRCIDTQAIPSSWSRSMISLLNALSAAVSAPIRKHALIETDPELELIFPTIEPTGGS